MCSDVLRCSQIFSDDHRCFWIFSRYSIDVLLMFSRCSQDVCRIFPGCFQNAPMGLVGLVEFVDHFKWKYGLIQRNSMIPAIRRSQLLDDLQLFNDPQLFHDQLEVRTLIIQKPTVIPPSLMILFDHLLLMSVCFFLFPIKKLEFLWILETKVVTTNTQIVSSYSLPLCCHCC